MRRWINGIGLLSLAACGSSTSAQHSAQAAVPKGAKIEASGFATIEEAPPSPFSDRLPPPENRPKDEVGFYAEMAGVSAAEAQKRVAEQHALRPELEKLMRTLRAREAGNFTDARMVHTPDWAYIFYFKREPERTLARHTSNLRFKAAQARYSREELQALAAPWVERFTRHRLLGGHGTDATVGEVKMDLVVSEAEFRTLAEREGWQLPDPVKLTFSDAAQGSSVAEEVRPFVRIFPHSDRALGPTNQALLGGKIVLRGGCFYVTGQNQPDRLAYFAREVGLGTDAQGYLALRTRGAAPRHLGRIGEHFSWGGPIGISETMPMVAELRAKCGKAPLEHVGVPDSSRLFSIRPWVIDAIAERRRISRDEAWRRFKSCLIEQEKKRPGAILDCDRL